MFHINRRKFLASSTVAALLATSAGSAWAEGETSITSSDSAGHYLPGGHNEMASGYTHSQGYPPFPDRANFIGVLAGDWHDMGIQFGVRSGDFVRCVSDIWWKEQCESWGKAETLEAIALYERQIEALDTQLIDFMKGIAEGAAWWLAQSPYSQPGHTLHSSNYQRVVAVNIYDEWTLRHPSHFPDGRSTYGGTAKPRPPEPSGTCSGFSAFGRGTRNQETVAAQNRHSPYDPRCYEQVFVIEPVDGIAS
jgi:hypothetical protein